MFSSSLSGALSKLFPLFRRFFSRVLYNLMAPDLQQKTLAPAQNHCSLWKLPDPSG